MFAFVLFPCLLPTRATQTARASNATEESESTRVVLRGIRRCGDPHADRTAHGEPDRRADVHAAPATATPSPTHTPAPDLTATQAAAQNAVLSAIAATQAALPTATLTPTPRFGNRDGAAAQVAAGAPSGELTAQPTATPAPLPPELAVVLADPFSPDENGRPTCAYPNVSGQRAAEVTDSVYRWTVQAAQGMFVPANPTCRCRTTSTSRSEGTA